MNKTFTFNYFLNSLTNRNENQKELQSIHSIIHWENDYPEVETYLNNLEQDVDDSIIENILEYAKEYAQKK